MRVMITVQKQQAIDLMLIGEKVIDIAKKVKVSSKTIYEWKKDPEFKAILEAQRKDMLSQADYFITSRIYTYLDELDKIATSGKDKRTQAQALIYLLDRGLGKAATKIEVKPVSEENEPESPESLLNEFSKFRKSEVIDITPDEENKEK